MKELAENALQFYGTNPGNWKFPWCRAFVNHVLDHFGIEHNQTLLARDALSIGSSVQTPKLGDIVVLWRDEKDSWKGHVGFFVHKDQTHVYLIGGNQDGIVKVKEFPLFRVLGYRAVKKSCNEKD